MNVSVTAAEDGKSRLDITVTSEEVDAAIDATYQRLAHRVRVPGFRPGKAPRSLLLRTYGDESFYHQATDEVLRRWYPKALAQSGVEAIDQGQVDLNDDHDHVKPGEPFEFGATVTVKPEVSLPDYHEITIPAPSTTVTDGDVDAVVEGIRTERASLEPAPARAAAVGDVVKMNLHGRSGGEDVLDQEDFEFELVDEKEDPHPRFPGLSEALVGATRGDIREVILDLPADYAEQVLAGHSLSLRIIVKEILRKVLPEMNDEFVREASSYQTVAELREAVRHGLEHEKNDEAANKVASDVIDSIIARSNLQVPEIMISDEQDRTVREHKRYFTRRGLAFDQFLVAAGKSEDEYRSEVRPVAERTVKRELILDAVAKAEGLEPSAEEVDAEVRRMSEAVSESERDVERLSGSVRLHESVAGEMRRRMALTKLVEITSGLKPLEHDHDDADEPGAEAGEADAPDLVEAGSAAEPQPV